MRINAYPTFEGQGNSLGYCYLRKTIQDGLQSLGVEICCDQSSIHPVMLAVNDPGGFYKLSQDQKLLAYSMFETSVLPAHMVQSIYACDRVMVPSWHNLRMIRDSGLDLCVDVIPMGVDTSVYRPRKRSQREQFTFLWVGATNTRKGFLEAYRAFCELAPDMPDARLVIKTTDNPRGGLNVDTPEQVGEVAQEFLEGIRRLGGAVMTGMICEGEIAPSSYNLDAIHTDGVELIKDKLSIEQLADLYHQADCFLFPSKGEADIGLTTLEAMASGLPVIANEWLFRDSDYPREYYYPLRYERVQASYLNDYWGLCGDWGVPDTEHLKELMWHVYTHREEASEVGARAAEWVKANRRWDQTIEGVYDVLRQVL